MRVKEKLAWSAYVPDLVGPITEATEVTEVTEVTEENRTSGSVCSVVDLNGRYDALRS